MIARSWWWNWRRAVCAFGVLLLAATCRADEDRPAQPTQALEAFWRPSVPFTVQSQFTDLDSASSVTGSSSSIQRGRMDAIGVEWRRRTAAYESRIEAEGYHLNNPDAGFEYRGVRASLAPIGWARSLGSSLRIWGGPEAGGEVRDLVPVICPPFPGQTAGEMQSRFMALGAGAIGGCDYSVNSSMTLSTVLVVEPWRWKSRTLQECIGDGRVEELSPSPRARLTIGPRWQFFGSWLFSLRWDVVVERNVSRWFDVGWSASTLVKADSIEFGILPGFSVGHSF